MSPSKATIDPETDRDLIVGGGTVPLGGSKLIQKSSWPFRAHFCPVLTNATGGKKDVRPLADCVHLGRRSLECLNAGSKAQRGSDYF